MSNRITAVHELALREGSEYFTLSAEYGLLKPEDSIPYYEHRLKPEEVGSLVERVTHQLRGRDVEDIIFFYEPRDPGAEPYLETIKEVCVKMSIRLSARAISKTESGQYKLDQKA